MKKLAMAMALAVTPLSAEAQNCLSLEQIHEAYTEQGLNTDMVFQSRVQDGRIMMIFATPEAPNMWQHWIEVVPTSQCFRSLGRGTEASNETVPFTTAPVKSKAPESKL
jgi:nitroimidazol reductase NimA-like FMN-containing flavoprotein (pyridoxamine 5'-phosphate oxidase superfamily)